MFNHDYLLRCKHIECTLNVPPSRSAKSEFIETVAIFTSDMNFREYIRRRHLATHAVSVKSSCTAATYQPVASNHGHRSLVHGQFD